MHLLAAACLQNTFFSIFELDRSRGRGKNYSTATLSTVTALFMDRKKPERLMMKQSFFIRVSWFGLSVQFDSLPSRIVSLFQIGRSIRFHEFSSINPKLLPLARKLGIAVIRGRHLFQDAFQTLPHRNHSLVVRFRYIPIRSFDPFIAVVSGIIKATSAVDDTIAKSG